MHDAAEHAEHAMQQPAEHAAQEPTSSNWLTIAEAAAALGVSVDTVRRRLKRGELQAEQVPTERGPVWRVCVNGLAGVPSVPGSNGHSTPGTPSSAAEHAMHESVEMRPELLRALEMLERAQSDVVAKAEAAAMWQTRAELLGLQVQQRDRELADVREELRALQAPAEPTESSASALTEEERQELEILRIEHELNLHRMESPKAPLEMKQRPWWQRLFG
jgi:excisionase family DNA binding protein